MTRTEIFFNIKSKIAIPEYNGDLIWCSDIRSLKNIAEEVYEHENHLSIDLGEITVFENIKLRFGTNSNDNYKLKSILGTFAKYNDAKTLCDLLISILDSPDEYYDVEEQLFVYWSDENIEIKVCTRDHHGGPWFEYSITKKTANNHIARQIFLHEYNAEQLKWIIRAFRLKKDISYSEAYIEDATFTNLREEIHPKKAIQDKRVAELLQQAYYQTFSDKMGFVPNLSVLDLIFNEGVKGNRYLMV